MFKYSQFLYLILFLPQVLLLAESVVRIQNLNATCGTADKIEFPSTATSFGNYTLCTEEGSGPLMFPGGNLDSISFPSAGGRVLWACSDDEGEYSTCYASVSSNNTCGTADKIKFPSTATTFGNYTLCTEGSLGPINLPSGSLGSINFPSAGSGVFWGCSDDTGEYSFCNASVKEHNPALSEVINPASRIALGSSISIKVKLSSAVENVYFSWGDGTTSVGANVIHTFGGAGRYYIRAWARNSNQVIIGTLSWIVFVDDHVLIPITLPDLDYDDGEDFLARVPEDEEVAVEEELEEIVEVVKESGANKIETDRELGSIKDKAESIELIFYKDDGTQKQVLLPKIEDKVIETTYDSQSVNFSIDDRKVSYNNNGTTENSISVDNKETIAVSFIAGTEMQFTLTAGLKTSVQIPSTDTQEAKDILIVATSDGSSLNSLSSTGGLLTTADSTILGTKTVILGGGKLVVNTPEIKSDLGNRITTQTTLDVDGQIVMTALRIKPDSTRESVALGNFSKGSNVKVQYIDGSVLVEIITELGDKE